MDDARNAFRAAVRAGLGYAPACIEPGKLQRFAVSDRRNDDAGWCRLFDDLRAGVYGDHRRGISETWRAGSAMPASRAERVARNRELRRERDQRETRQRADWARNAERIERLWNACVPIERSDPAALYLARRGLGDAWPVPSCLRVHPSLPYFDGETNMGRFPAMVATLIATNGRTVALHRTYLSRGGRKANVPNAKKLTATAGSLVGACIPLFKPERGVVGIAEGIETAIASHLASGVPTIAAYSASSLATWQWSCDVSRIVIFADADDAGRKAGAALSARAYAKGKHCEVLIPACEGTDWADVWATRSTFVGEGTP